ncbi:MAG: OmpA family protein [Lachnospiraceae bacterium]|nr:OmpA family protein [Lachnospiraceae bacterium]
MFHRKHKSGTTKTQYWLSYSDMMAGLLLVFVLIIAFTMLQAKSLYEEKEEELEKQRKIAEEQQQIAQEQQELVDQQKEIMKEQQEQLDRIIGVRTELVEALKEEFDGTSLKVSVDPQTGSITLDSSVLFDTNKSEIKETGEVFLKEFLPRYISVLMAPEFKDYIAEIIIEGHTDTDGGYIYNLRLSQERAFSVASFCMDDDNNIISEGDLEDLRKIITANGRSFSNPILNDNGEINKDASRRVEFKFRLRDEDMVDEMMKILNEVQ